MPFPIGAHLKVTQTFHYTPANAYARCIFYYLSVGGPIPDIDQMPAVANFFGDEYATQFQAVMPVGVNMSQTEAVWKFASIQYDGASTGVVVAGSVVGEILPEEDCVCVQKRTGEAGRNKRGRWFFPFVPEALQASGELTVAALTDWKETCQSLRVVRVDGSLGMSWKPVLADSKTGTWVDIVDCRVVNQVCNKRQRRNPKRLTVTAAPFGN
jgi:hypothetical protein